MCIVKGCIIYHHLVPPLLRKTIRYHCLCQVLANQMRGKCSETNPRRSFNPTVLSSIFFCLLPHDTYIKCFSFGGRQTERAPPAASFLRCPQWPPVLDQVKAKSWKFNPRSHTCVAVAPPSETSPATFQGVHQQDHRIWSGARIQTRHADLSVPVDVSIA